MPLFFFFICVPDRFIILLPFAASPTSFRRSIGVCVSAARRVPEVGARQSGAECRVDWLTEGASRLLQAADAVDAVCRAPSTALWRRRRGRQSSRVARACGKDQKTKFARKGLAAFRGIMTTIKNAAVDARQHDSADEVSKSLVSLEGARGCFSGKVIDYRIPCTATADTTCQIVASLSLWNEFLCWLELELRDLSDTGRQLGLAHLGVTCLPWPTESRMRQAAAVLYWLLKTHRCIASICVASGTFSPEIAQLLSAVLCDVLRGNDSVKSLALESASTLQSERFCEVILSLQRLEQLRCAFFSNRSAFLRTVSAFLQASATLTVLDFRVSLETAQARLLVTALRANSTLRDLSLSATAILAEPASFVTFLSGTATLERLKVVGSAGSLGDDALKWIFEGMLENGTVSTLEAHELNLDSESVELGAKVLAQSKVLRRFELLRSLSLLEDPLVRELTGSAVSHDTASWQEAILQNDTIRYVTLRLNTWTDEYWGRFFRLLSRHRSLKLVTVVAGTDECGRLSDVAEKLEEAGCEDKVSLAASCVHDTFSIANCKRCPELRARIGPPAVAATLSVFQQLSAYSCLKIVRLTIEDWEKELCWLFAECVSTTCTLRTLDLQLTVPELPPESLDWWPALSRSLLLNRSIMDFGLGVFVDSCEDVECLGEAVTRSSTIRKLRLLMWLPAARRSFLRGMHAGIFENRTLCSATLDSGSTYGPWAADWFVVCDTARRNWGCVARAAQFLNHARQDTPCAAALDRVYRHPALMAELSEVLSITEAETVAAVRQCFQSIEGLDDFMRLAGVVKERVKCLPRHDGSTQLDDLNEQCWAHVRRYLQLDDVSWDGRSSMNPAESR